MNTESHIPTCVGIIMDGNRRWAQAKSLPSFEGHRAGSQTVKDIVQSAHDAGVKHIVFFTFSTENWKRTEDEVSYLLGLIERMIVSELDYFNVQNGILHFVGDLSKFSPKMQKALVQSAETTKNNTGIHVYFALNYGGRAEILSAVKKIVAEHPTPEMITDEYFETNLQSYPMPDPDIIIRTSGEMRLSGFLPWQGVYSELFFTKTLWPDFSKEEFLAILKDFSTRYRRLGK